MKPLVDSYRSFAIACFIYVLWTFRAVHGIFHHGEVEKPLRWMFIGMYCFCICSAFVVTLRTPSIKEKAISVLTALCLLLSLSSHYVHLEVQQVFRAAAACCWILAAVFVLTLFRQATNVIDSN